MWLGREPMSLPPSFIHEPDDISVQKPVEFSQVDPQVLPEVSYRSGRPRSWAYSWANTPTPPFSGSIV